MGSILITGGGGFIGVNAALYFAEKGYEVTILDNLSRKGAEANLAWLGSQVAYGFEKADIRDRARVDEIVRELAPDVLLHLAAQVAVTTSVSDPREDFEINAWGTFNLLDAVRVHSPGTFFIYASTNKVYGKMEDVGTVERNGRYEYRDLAAGVGEGQPLDFHSPYGCSKGTADQYVTDFSRIYGLKTVVFRQSCIYGPRQFGIEDQGWVAWFIIASLLDRQITVYGDGKQIRDVLHVKDLVRLYELAARQRDAVSGDVFNVGGGPANTLSLLELLAMLKERLQHDRAPAFGPTRPGDQPVFVCDIRKAERVLGWKPEIDTAAGVALLIDWVRENRSLFE
jgi:CDP-paratose 2-epimerase